MTFDAETAQKVLAQIDRDELAQLACDLTNIPSPTENEPCLKRQKVLADFGDFALQSENLDDVQTETCRLVGEAMGTGRAKVLEIEEGECPLFSPPLSYIRFSESHAF